MMFIQYAVPACTSPILSYYLMHSLRFSPMGAGQIMSMTAVGAIVAPFLAMYVADRCVSARVMLAGCHLLSGVVMLWLVRQTQFHPFLWIYFLYGLVFLPTHGLSNTVALHHVTDVKRDFGGIRMWGTAGWVVVAWTFGLFWLRGGVAGGPDPRLPHALVLAALLSFALAVYALTLPEGERRPAPPMGLVPWEALKVFARPSVLLLAVTTLFISMIHQHYYYGMGPFLSRLGIADNHIMPLMSIGQFSEVIVLGYLGRVLARFGVKRVLLIGACAQVFRYVVFALGGPFPLILAGIVAHGFCYAFFFTAGYIYVDAHSPRSARAGAQQLYSILIMGFGYFAGHMIAGAFGRRFAEGDEALIDFHRFWSMPALFALVVVAALVFLFREEAPALAPDTNDR